MSSSSCHQPSKTHGYGLILSAISDPELRTLGMSRVLPHPNPTFAALPNSSVDDLFLASFGDAMDVDADFGVADKSAMPHKMIYPGMREAATVLRWWGGDVAAGYMYCNLLRRWDQVAAPPSAPDAA
jgi:hypothetical protein